MKRKRTPDAPTSNVLISGYNFAGFIRFHFTRNGSDLQMKKYLIAGIFIALAAWFAADALFPDTKTITVPVRVFSGDTLDDICSRAALKYGDVRNDLREIVYYTCKRNNITDADLIQPGDVILVELEVPLEQEAKNAAKN